MFPYEFQSILLMTYSNLFTDGSCNPPYISEFLILMSTPELKRAYVCVCVHIRRVILVVGTNPT